MKLSLSRKSLVFDVLEHGKPKRKDMVGYFGEQLSGFALTVNGRVQSYGPHYAKPLIICDDACRPEVLTVF